MEIIILIQLLKRCEVIVTDKKINNKKNIIYLHSRM